MLGPTGTQPQQAYGHVAQGASPIQVNNMRRNTKLGTTMGGTKSCITSTIAWFYSCNKDPGVGIRVEQLVEWIDIWEGFDDNKRTRIRKKLKSKSTFWALASNACGVIAKALCLQQSARFFSSNGPLLLLTGGSPKGSGQLLVVLLSLKPTSWHKRSTTLQPCYGKMQLHIAIVAKAFREARAHTRLKGLVPACSRNVNTLQLRHLTFWLQGRLETCISQLMALFRPSSHVSVVMAITSPLASIVSLNAQRMNILSTLICRNLVGLCKKQ